MLSFGGNSSGCLGQGDAITRITPTLTNSALKSLKQAACGSRVTFVLTPSGKLYGCGSTSSGQLGDTSDDGDVLSLRRVNIEDVASVATRGSHVLACDTRGRVFAWGRGDDGFTQAGKQGIPNRINIPQRVDKVAVGRMHSVALDADGRVWTWGIGAEGQTGLGSSRDVMTPTPLLSITDKVIDISCGSRHTLLLTQSGKVFGFGGNAYCQLGTGDNSPVMTPRCLFDAATVVGIACGYRHSLFWTDANEIYGCGWNSHGQACPLESVDIVKYPTKIQIPGLVPEGAMITSIAGGGRHTLLAVRVNDEVVVHGWGRGTSGELGSPVLEEVRRPRAILMIPDVMESEISISCGWEHSVIVSPNSVVGFRLISGAIGGFSVFDYLRGWLGDIDASFAQLVNGIVLLKFINPAGRARAALYTTAISNLIFSVQAWMRGGTSLPHGVNTVALFSLNTQVYTPVLQSTGSVEKATSAMLFCTIVLGLFQLVASLGLAQLVAKHIPQAALLACVAGIALVYIATNFSAQMFAESHASFAPFIIFLIGFLSRERMPFGVPVAAVALAAGWLLSTGEEEGLVSIEYNPEQVVVSPYDAIMDSSNYPYIFTVIIPLFIVTIVGNLACVEQARASGDEYSASVSLGLDSLATLVGATVFGSCVPTCIYLGSVGFKQWGATHWYTVIVSAILFLLAFEYQPLVYLLAAIPRVAAVGMLVYVGLVVTGDAFKLKKHVASVVFGLVPAVASFALQPSKIGDIETSHNPYEVLGKGYLILSIIFASTAALLCERRFVAATVWLLIAGALTLSGLIHEHQTQDCFVGYLSGACVTALWAIAQWHRGEREIDVAEQNIGDFPTNYAKLDGFRGNSQRDGTLPTSPEAASTSTTALRAANKDNSYGSV